MHDHTTSPNRDAVDERIEALAASDPADAPPGAEALAQELATALDGAEPEGAGQPEAGDSTEDREPE